MRRTFMAVSSRTLRGAPRARCCAGSAPCTCWWSSASRPESACSPTLAPSVTAASLFAAWWFARRSGLTNRHAVAAAVVVVTVLAASLALAATFMDLTWDGQWYHQTAVYKMAEGWNPLRDPVHDFGRHTWNLWVLHYAKGPWYVALALFVTTGNIEIAKAASAIAPAIALLVVVAAALDLGLERRWAILVGLLIALNPVTTCGIVTHQVDGILVSLMACCGRGRHQLPPAPALAARSGDVRVRCPVCEHQVHRARLPVLLRPCRRSLRSVAPPRPGASLRRPGRRRPPRRHHRPGLQPVRHEHDPSREPVLPDAGLGRASKPRATGP